MKSHREERGPGNLINVVAAFDLTAKRNGSIKGIALDSAKASVGVSLAEVGRSDLRARRVPRIAGRVTA